MILEVQASSFVSQSLNQIPVPVLYETQWQIANDIGFSDIVFDTWFQTVFLTNFTHEILVTPVYVRLRYRDNYGVISEWSLPLLVASINPQSTLERAWAFTLDGHTFYVLNFLTAAALIYDLTADQWYRWYGQDVRGLWNMFRGIVWQGRVIAAGVEDENIWELDPHSMLDEETDPIERFVTGLQPLRGSASARVGSLRVTARKEDATQPSTLTMRFSDDNGKTWSTPRTVVLAGNSYSQRLEFRSLGRVRAPGRIWEISDTGGFVRIDGADSNTEGE